MCRTEWSLLLLAKHPVKPVYNKFQELTKKNNNKKLTGGLLLQATFFTSKGKFKELKKVGTHEFCPQRDRYSTNGCYSITLLFLQD